MTDQHGKKRVLIGSGPTARWFRVADFAAGGERQALRDLADGDTPALQAKSRNALLREVEEFKCDRPALVAARPGWVGPSADGAWCYVLGDGTVLMPKPAAGRPPVPVIVGFQPDAKFAPAPARKCGAERGG